MSGLDALSRRLAPAEDVERSGGEWWTRRLSGEAPQLRLPRGKGRADWLHAAALTATGALLSGRSVERIFRSPAADMSNKAEERGAAERSAELWRCFLRESEHEDFVAHLDDLVLFAAASMLARRPVELRSWLRSPAGAQAMQPVRASGDWLAHVRASISRAALLLLRQADHRDLQETIRAIDALAAAQREHDAAGIADPRAAAMALGLYHVAHAASRLSEFLLAGSVLTRGRRVDVGPELLRLLSKAEEFFRLSGSPELHIWLRAITALFTHQRSDSIWVSAGGMGTTVDLLLRRLAQEGREQPIFTLLPSQREALQSRLLDPAQVAVVLQMPTSAGKTLLAEFAIAQVVGTYGRGARIAYVAPTRALCTQIQSSLRADLAALGIPVSAAGGAFEEDPYELNLLQETDGVVVSTPEKLDLLLRAHPDWAAGLRLVVIDEAHTLNDRERGARLELLLANLRREQSQARLLLLTPFIENAAQIAEWLGEGRSTPITVHWRPSRLLLGVPTVEGRGRIRRVDIDWLEPHRDGPVPAPLRLEIEGAGPTTARERVVHLARRLSRLGTVLGMFASSRTQAEKAAQEARVGAAELAQSSPALRVAMASADEELGPGNPLTDCLRCGIAWHHSALSPLLRYLIEDQVRAGTIRFVAATTTLAQGMNFPVASVLVHSVAKPSGGGDLSATEFWNIAGRAGRVGLAEEGLVIFANDAARETRTVYRDHLNATVVSALLQALEQGIPEDPQEAYRKVSELRPFLQFIAHAVVTLGYPAAVEQLEETLQASLAFHASASPERTAPLRLLARRYLDMLRGQREGMLKMADQSGLGSFSFNSLYAHVRGDALLEAGPSAVLRSGVEGLTHLVDALKNLPEMDLGVDRGAGEMDAAAVARVAARWMRGEPVCASAMEFTGEDEAEKIRKAGTYVYSKVTGILSWGAHAYARSHALLKPEEVPPEDRMLPAYLHYGVDSPEAAVAALVGLPRPLARAAGVLWREREGRLAPGQAGALRDFVEGADLGVYAALIERSSWRGLVSPQDAALVVRQMMGRRG